MRFAFGVFALSLASCAGSDVAVAPPLDLITPGTVLVYDVAVADDVHPFAVTIVQNDDAGTIFDFDLALGQAEGRVMMSPAAREAASRGVMSTFGTQEYTLDDQTAVWMARSDFRRLKAGDEVEIDLGAGPAALALDECGTTTVPVHGADVILETCQFVGEAGQTVVTLDDGMEPLIIDLDTGAFRVTLQGVTR